jgi:NAD(P)-dependent dehydrogenase (short-subunit alcohol dehydrogenase family)/acyl carrier protein
LSAVRDRVPGLPELDNDRMSALRTLDEVVAYLAEVGGSAAGPVATPSAGASREQLVDAMFASVADKTGYPTDMLELSMQLEGDLGIDSIKRVEILSAVRDRVPGLPELDNDRMSALRTLDEVVAYLAEAAGVPSDAGGGALALPTFLKRPQTVDRATLQGAVLDAIAGKTGYPRDSLEPGMQLEGDLGIDSIKRVEILSAVRDAVPSLPELDNDRLSALRSVADVVDHLASVAAGLGFATIGSGATRSAGPALIVPPAGTPEPLPAPAGLPPVQSASDVVVAVPSALRRRVVRLVGAPPAVPVAPGAWAFVGVPEELASALAERGVREVALGAPEADGVLFVADPHADDVLEAAFLAAQQAPASGRFALLVRGDGGFGRRSPDGDGLDRALTGLAKTMALERPAVRCLALDAAPDVGVERIADELLSDRGVVEVALTSDEVGTLVSADEQAPTPGELPLSAGDLVVVSGGARGVTAAVVVELASRVPLKLLLLGRSAVDDADPAWAEGVADDALQAAALADARQRGVKVGPKEMRSMVSSVLRDREVRHTLARIRLAGSEVRYVSTDVRDADAVARAVSEAVECYGPVRAVVHGAGVLADRRIEDKPLDGFRSVVGTKLDGLQALLGAVDPDQLSVLALFSSTAGRFGNTGQCDYSMANEALLQRALALKAAHPALRAKVFDWGPWDGGMVDASLKKHFAAQAVGVIPLSLGARLFVDELGRADDVEVVIEGPRPRDGNLKRTLRAHAPWLDHHRISGKPVVPAAMVLEWCTAVARSVYPALSVRAVRDLDVLKGVVFDDDARTLTLSWSSSRPADGDAALDFELTSHDGPLGLPLVHYRATVELGGALASQTHPGSNGLGATPYPHPVGEAYERFLFHGPALHGIDEIVGTSDHGMVAWLRTSTPAALGVADATWHTDPLAVDSTLQLMLLWVREHLGLGALPTAVGTFRQLRPFHGRVACHLEVDRADAHTGGFSATLVAEDGGIVARLEGGRYAADKRLDAAFGLA